MFWCAICFKICNIEGGVANSKFVETLDAIISKSMIHSENVEVNLVYRYLQVCCVKVWLTNDDPVHLFIIME